MVTAEERQQIEQNMKKAGITNMRAYLLQMALSGFILQVDLSCIREMIKLLTTVSSQMEQIAKRLHDCGVADNADLQQIQQHNDEIWRQTKAILLELAKI